MYILSEEHQNAAIAIACRNRKKKSCNKCYDRAFIGYTPEKMIVTCYKCVGLEKAHKGWQEYVEADPDLKAELLENNLYSEEEVKPEEVDSEALSEGRSDV